MLKKVIALAATAVLGFSTLSAGTLEDVQKSGVLKAGVKYDFKPFGFVDAKGTVVGFDIDLINYVAGKLGVKATFSQVTSKTRIPMVQNGTIDIAAASMTHKVKRDEPIDFTVSYFFDGQSILVRKDAKQESYKDFAGVKVGAIQGATSGANFSKVQPNAKIVTFQEYPQAIMALKKGKIDAITTDLVWCTTQANDSKGTLKVIGDTISNEPYGMGVRENDSNFRDAVNFAIQDAVKDGTYTKLYVKWFGKNPPVLPEVWP